MDELINVAPEGHPDNPASIPKVRKPRSDKGQSKAKKAKKPTGSRYLQLMYRLGTIERVGAGDEGEAETRIVWGKDVSILPPANDRETMLQQIMQLAQHADTCDQFVNKRVQLVAVLDEFTMQIEVQAKAKVVR